MTYRVLAVAMLALSACSGAAHVSSVSLEPARLPFHTDSSRSEQLAQGVTHHYLYTSEGPWAIHLLDVPRSSCVAFRAVKAHHTAQGREPATLLLEQLDEHERVIAGVNADYFSLTNGVPVGMHVEDGRVIAGPSGRSVLAFDSAGAPFIGVLRTAGSVTFGDTNFPVAGWNRIAEHGFSLMDRSWGTTTDSASGRVEVTLSGPAPRMMGIDTLPQGVPIPPAGVVLIAGKNAPDMRRTLLSLSREERIQVQRTIQPIMPREAVGGWQVILRDGAITSEVDSGATNGPVRHPRTAAATFSDGHVMLLVVDGRQKPYSDGMTLREVARVFQALGAREAINLDGGGSSTFVLRDQDGVMRVQNRPSDKVERPVSNVMAVVNRC